MSASCALAQSLGERDTDFDIVLERSYEKPDGYLAQVTTTNTYPCAGYSINSVVRRDGDTVSVHFLGLLRPSPCVQSSDEATGTAFVGDLAGPDVFIRFQYRGYVDLYKLVWQKGRLKPIPIQQSFTSLR
jgi:hypothetical protein